MDKERIRELENELSRFAHFIDPFKVSWRRRGSMQNLLMDYVLDPELVHGLARIATDFDMAAIDGIHSAIEDSFDGNCN